MSETILQSNYKKAIFSEKVYILQHYSLVALTENFLKEQLATEQNQMLKDLIARKLAGVK